MKRLTMYDKKSGHAEVARFPEFLSELRRTQPFREATELTLAMNKLAEYEDLEEQGLLVRMPCKVGDTVWVNSSIHGNMCEGTVTSVRIGSDSCVISITAISSITGDEFGFLAITDYFGATVFLTRAEAKATLEKMEQSK